MNAVVITEAQIYSALIDAFAVHGARADMDSYVIPASDLRAIAKAVSKAGEPTEVLE